MICILLNTDDVAGIRLSRLLQRVMSKQVKLISADELVYASSFNCGFNNEKAFYSVQLHNNFLFSNQTVTAVINRIEYLPKAHLQQFILQDKAYVAQELDAVFVFLFSLLPNIFNKPTVQGFCGKRLSQMQWLQLAYKSGFRTQPFYYESKILQAVPPPNNGKCYGLSNDLQYTAAKNCCQKLGKLSEETILQIWFWLQNGQPYFAHAHTQPDFENISEEFINDVIKFL
jgi:hypothetical protein